MNLRIQVVDGVGRLRFHRKETFPAGVHTLPVPHLPRGIYFLRVESPVMTETRKVLLLP